MKPPKKIDYKALAESFQYAAQQMHILGAILEEIKEKEEKNG